jgi:hypothetical protein
MQGMNTSEISRRLEIRRATIIEWLGKTAHSDQRGWKAGVKRSHTDLEEKRVAALKQQRIDGKKFFLGTSYIQMDYAKQYPTEPPPSTWFIDEVVRRHGLQTHEPKKRGKGQNIVSRLLFPIRSIVSLGAIQQSMDFIGKKFIAGSSVPVSIFSTSYYQGLQLFQIQRVLAEKAEYVVRCLTGVWRTFPIADVLRMDNGLTWRGSGSGKGTISRCVRFLLNLGVKPLFSAPYQSYTNPHIEGHNRTFTEKLWRRNFFTSLEQIDEECVKFNAESRELYDWKFKERLSGSGLRYLGAEEAVSCDILRSTKGKKIYFIRFVERWKENDGRVGVVVLNRLIDIPDAYLNQYVFVALDLETASVTVASEHHGVASVIVRKPFSYIL